MVEESPRGDTPGVQGYHPPHWFHVKCVLVTEHFESESVPITMCGVNFCNQNFEDSGRGEYFDA